MFQTQIPHQLLVLLLASPIVLCYLLAQIMATTLQITEFGQRHLTTEVFKATVKDLAATQLWLVGTSAHWRRFVCSMPIFGGLYIGLTETTKKHHQPNCKI